MQGQGPGPLPELEPVAVVIDEAEADEDAEDLLELSFEDSDEISIELPDLRAAETATEIPALKETPQPAASRRTPTGQELAESAGGSSPPSADTARTSGPAAGLDLPAARASLMSLRSSDSPPPRLQLERLFGTSGTGGTGGTGKPGEAEPRSSRSGSPFGAAHLDEIIRILARELYEGAESDGEKGLKEAVKGLDPVEVRELLVRLALLIWDGYGRPDIALPLVEGNESTGPLDHPVAVALRLQAAVDHPRPGEALLDLAQKLRRRFDGYGQVGRAEVGELLLFRGAYGTAAELLAEAAADASAVAGAKTSEQESASLRRWRALALALLGKRLEAAALLEKDPAAERGELLWAAHLYEQAGEGEAQSERLSRLLERVSAPAGPGAAVSPLALLLAMERLHGLKLCAHNRQALLPLLAQKLELLGGQPALTHLQLVPSAEEGPHPLRRLELLSTALQLAGLLAEQGNAAADLEAATLYDAVASFTGRHKEAAGPLGRCLALLESARLCERRGDREAAAERFEAAGMLLLETGALASVGTSSEPAHSTDAARLDRAAHAAALAYLLRAAELLTATPASGRVHGEAAAAHASVLYGRLSESGASDEVLVLRRLYLLLSRGREAYAEVVASLAGLAETAPPPHNLRFAAWAARAAEALRVPGVDVHGALSLTPADGTSIEQRLRDIEALARRARRRGDSLQLVQLYTQIASLGARPSGAGAKAEISEAVAAAAAVYQGVAVVLRAGLAEEYRDSAELTSLKEAAELQASRSGGILIDATRVLFRQQLGPDKVPGRADDLGQALTSLIGRVRSRDTQIELYRQLGHYAAEHAGDQELAERSFHQVLARRPDDVMALHALARLVQQRGETAQAVALLQQAVEAALRMPPATGSGQKEPPPGLVGGLPGLDALLSRGHEGRLSSRDVGAQAAALLCCELGALYEQLAHTASEPTAAIDQAVACYSEALRRDPRCRTAARALVSLYRAMQRPAEMLAAMELLLPLLRGDSQRLGLLLEMGEAALQQALATAAERGSAAERSQAALPAFELALRAYSEALSLQPDNATAILHLTMLCRRLGRYALLAESLQPAPHTMQVLEALREAYENVGETRALAAVLEEQLGLLVAEAGQGGQGTRSAVVSCARSLALLYQRLEQPDEEARTWERLYDLAPEELWNDVPVLLVLERRYGQSGRHAEQAGLLSRALEHLQNEQARRPDDLELRSRRRALLLRLGDVQRDFLAAPAQATATFEQVLREWPEEQAALLALAGLYGSQGRPDDQLRVLTSLLELTVDPAARSRLLFQLGELDEKKGNAEDAYQRYGQAFYLDASNRNAFTAYERLCYRREQWQEALRIYDTALKLIETQKTRSYRPADLHVRRGQVLLQYLQKTDEALSHYLRALETDAENDATQATVERIYAGRNQWRELLVAYERRAQLVREDMKRVEILRRAARVATAKLRDVAEAVRCYEKLHAVDPTDSEALDALEHHYDRSHDYEKLYGLLSTRVALSVDEQQIIALNMRIGLLCEEGLRDHDRAISAYRHVVEQQPTHREALDAMARLFEANERWAELIDVTRRQIRLVTDRAQKALLYFKCGSVTEAKFGKEDDAIRYYEAAVRTSAACLPALHSLRDIYIRREDWTRVTQTLELESKLWTEDKERAGILAHIGQIYLDKLGADARALEFFEQALSVDKDCLPANRALFQIYFQRGDWERALGASQVLLQKASREGEPSERSEFHRKRALVALHLGHLRTACESVTTALEIYPENLQVLELLEALCHRHHIGFDFGPLCRELEKQFRRRELSACLSRVLCAQAALGGLGADVESNEALLKEAVRLSPDDHLPTEALAALYERLRRFAEARELMESFIAYIDGRPESSALLERRTRMQLRLAEMCSAALMDAAQAAALLRPLCAPGRQLPAPLVREARFRLSQELYVLGRYDEARGEIERLIEETSAKEGGLASLNEEGARYYDYLGRILEAQGEDTAAQRAYRRAVDLDPSFAQPVLALARRAVRGGDRAQAELLMRDALAQLSRRNRPALASLSMRDERGADRLDEELRLRRGIARLLATFDPEQAAEAYQRIIEAATQRLLPDTLQVSSWLDDRSEPLAAWETLDDRVALAELLHRLGNNAGARQELSRVLRRDLRHAPAYQPLIELYTQDGQLERAERARALFLLLGYADATSQKNSERRGARLFGFRQALSDDLRERYLWPQALRGTPYFELLAVTLEGLLRLFPSPWPLADEPQPASRLWDASFKVALADAQRLFGLEVELMFASQVPGYTLALEPPQAGGRPVVIMDQSVLGRTDAERRFLLGRALEPLRSGYALLLRLSSTEATRWLRLCRGLLGSPQERDAATQEFIAQLPPASQQAVERLAGLGPGPALNSASAATPAHALMPEDFLGALPLLSDRAGLLLCDDIAAAVRMMAAAQGEELAVVTGQPGQKGPGDGAGILLGQVSGGAELARYYLCDSYHELVAALRDTSRL